MKTPVSIALVSLLGGLAIWSCGDADDAKKTAAKPPKAAIYQFDLSWDASKDATVKSYVIYAAASKTGDFVEVETVEASAGAKATLHSDDDPTLAKLVDGEEVCFRLTSKSAAGTASDFTAALCEAL